MMKTRTYRMLDPQVVAHARHAVLKPGPIVKEPRAPLFGEDRPWEVRIDNMYANVLHDPTDGLYKCWYNPFIQMGPSATGLCYAESTDGIVWRKPSLGRVEFQGSRDNNLVMASCHGAGIRLHPCPTHPDERFLAIYLPDMASVRNNAEKTETRETLRLRLRIATSPDGIDWTDLPGVRMPVYPYTQADTHNNLLYDAARERWVAFTRAWDDDPHTGDGRPAHRLVARLQSPDLRSWTRPVDILRELPEELGRRQTYAMPVMALDDGFLGLVMMWNCDHDDDTVDCEMAWSPDSQHWTRICPGQPLIPRGAPGAFDSHCLYAACEPLQDASGAMRLYYGGSNGPHGGARVGGLGLAYLRPDGFAGMAPDSPTRRAVIVTRPVDVTGDRLLVTADAAGGELRVAVPGMRGFSAARCRPIQSDATRVEVRWDGADWSKLRGRTVPLRFECDRATVYAFYVGDPERTH